MSDPIRRIIRRAAGAVLAACLAGPAAADVQKGNEALEKGDTKTALREYNAAAKAGDAEAMFNLSRLYAEGKGVKADRKIAFEWMEKAARTGYVRAQGSLAMFHAEGIGTNRDDAKSLEWGRRAAEAGDVISQFIMGVRYNTGTGVERDPVQATSWWTRAANRGFMRAQVALADQLIARSAAAGVRPEDAGADRVEAVKWLLLAGGDSVPGVDKRLADLKQKMTPEDFGSAEDKARDWRPSGD